MLKEKTNLKYLKNGKYRITRIYYAYNHQIIIMARLYLIIITTFISISSIAQSYRVTATFPDFSFNGQVAVLSTSYDGNVLENVVIKENKAFFTGQIKEPVLCMIQSDRARGQLILEKGDISIEMKLSGGVSVGSGTPLNDALGGLISKYNELMDDIMNYKGEDKEEYYKNVWTPNFTKEIGDIFKANNNNDIGTMALMYLSNYGQEETIDDFFAQAGEVVTSRGPIQKIIKQRLALKQTAEGLMFTDFTIEGSDGQSVSFSEYVGKGKYVLVDFWAGWCGPCKREIPNIREIYDKYNGEDFTVLGVAVWEKPEDTKKAIKELGVIWPCIINAQSIPTDVYGIMGIPYRILFGPDGTILARGLRGDTIKETIIQVINSL